MPKVLVLKAQGRHVYDHFWDFWAKFWPEKIPSHDGCLLRQILPNPCIFSLLQVEFLRIFPSPPTSLGGFVQE